MKSFSQINYKINLNNKLLPEIRINNKNYDKNNIMEINGKNKILKNNIQLIHLADKIIFDYFSSLNRLCRKPKYEFSSNTININLFYYLPNKIERLNNNSINFLGNLLRKIFQSKVKLNLIKLNYPYLERRILAEYISLNSHEYKFAQIVKNIFGKISLLKNNNENDELLPNLIICGIVGIKIKVSGRLTLERSKPRQTKQTIQIGSFSNNEKSIIDYSSFTRKNKKNSFTVKVWINNKITL